MSDIFYTGVSLKNNVCDTGSQTARLQRNVFLFLQGYQGMVDGGDHIMEAQWKDVSNIPW